MEFVVINSTTYQLLKRPVCVCVSETGGSYWSQARCVGPQTAVPTTEWLRILASASAGVRGGITLRIWKVLQTLCPECQLLGWLACVDWVPAAESVWDITPQTVAPATGVRWGSQRQLLERVGFSSPSHWNSDGMCSKTSYWGGETGMTVGLYVCVCIWLERIKNQLLGALSVCIFPKPGVHGVCMHIC